MQQWKLELWELLFFRKEISQLEEGDVGTLHPIFQLTCHLWITFMEKLGKCFLKVLNVSRKVPGLSSCVPCEQAARLFSSAVLTSLLTSSCHASWWRS